MNDLRKELFLAYLERGRHIENILLGFSRFMFALQASVVAVAGFLLTQALHGVDSKLRLVGAIFMLLVGALIGLLAVPVLTAIRRYSQAYVARRNPLELKLADEAGLPEYRAMIEAKHAERYSVTNRLKWILVVIALMCLAGASGIYAVLGSPG